MLGFSSQNGRISLTTSFESVVERGLDESDARSPLGARPIECMFHELTSDLRTLNFRVDGDRAEAYDARALVEKIASDDAAVDFGDDSIEAGMRKHGRQEPGGNFQRRPIGREVVFLGDPGEGLVADLSARLRIFRLGRSECSVHYSPLRPDRGASRIDTVYRAFA